MENYKLEQAYINLKSFIVEEVQKVNDENFDDSDAFASDDAILLAIFKYAQQQKWPIEGIEYESLLVEDFTENEHEDFPSDLRSNVGEEIYYGQRNADIRLQELLQFWQDTFDKDLNE